MPRQFVAVQFGGKGRSYTYHHDGEPLELGEKVRVETRHSEQIAEITGLSDEAPPFETKPILGKAADAANPELF